MECKDFEEKVSLYLYEELSGEERAAAESHLASCQRCGALLAQSRRLLGLLDQHPAPAPTPGLLAECRQALDDSLDFEPAPQRGLEGILAGWVASFRLRPAFGAAGVLGVLLLGFSGGWTLRPHFAALLGGDQASKSATVGADIDLSNARLGGMRVTPDPDTGEVHITLDAQHRMTLQGSLDDPRIQQVLLNAMKNYDNAGIRRESVDALREGGDRPNVRQALLFAMRNDSNLGVRLEALDVARALNWGQDSRQAFLDVLDHDTNPGLRLAAIETLRRHPDSETLRAFERLAANDDNRYVRLKCAATLREAESK